MTILRSYGLCALSPETRFLHIFLLTQPFIFVETGNKRPHAIASRLCYTVMFICAYLFIAVLKPGEVCPMPHAPCPMPHALCPMPARAPHVTEKGYTLPALDRTATSQATDLGLKYGKSDRHDRQKPSSDGIDCTQTYCLCQRSSHDRR